MRLVPGIGITSGALRQQPGEAELRHGAALLGGDRLDPLDQRAVLLRNCRPRSAGAGRGCRPAPRLAKSGTTPAKQAAAERGVGDKGDAEVAGQLRASRSPPRGRAAKTRSAPRRSGGSHAPGGCARAAPRRGRESAPCPARRAAPSRRPCPRPAPPDRPGAGNRGRSTSTPSRFRLASQACGDIVRAAVDAVGAARPLGLAELGRDHDLVAPALQRAAEQFLVLAPAIHVRAVEMIDAEIDRALDQLDRRPSSSLVP